MTVRDSESARLRRTEAKLIGSKTGTLLDGLSGSVRPVCEQWLLN